MNAALLIVSLLSFSGDFDADKKSALPIESLRKTVTTVIGVCDAGDGFERQECKKALKQKRAKYTDAKSLYLYLGAQERGLRSDGIRKGKTRLLWTPVIDVGDGVAITLARPKRVTKSGSIVVPTEVIDLSLEGAMTHSKVNRLLRTGQMGVEMVGTFGKTWEMRGQRGVVFIPKSIRFTHARSGESVGEINLKP